MMLSLQALGCHNVNLVTPSHVVAQILGAVTIAAERGLRLPLVYNTGGYGSLEALALLDGVVDIYMPDMKYGDDAAAHKYSHVRDYVRVNQAAVREMHRQVGDLAIDAAGLAERGLLVRHLALPNGLAGTEAALRFLAEEISSDTYLKCDGPISAVLSGRRAPRPRTPDQRWRVLRGACNCPALWTSSPRSWFGAAMKALRGLFASQCFRQVTIRADPLAAHRLGARGAPPAVRSRARACMKALFRVTSTNAWRMEWPPSARKPIASIPSLFAFGPGRIFLPLVVGRARTEYK